MVEGRLKLEPEVCEIFDCIDGKRNFLLSGGAGSGKTYSLVNVIRQVIVENPTAKVACMTYTNSAVREIEERVSHQNLNISTIHDFLWDNIKHFQKHLKEAIITMANDPDMKNFVLDESNNVPLDYFDKSSDAIQYKDFLRLHDGIISHDEVLIIANYLFMKYPKLCDIVKDKYRFIFIDEYQDTSNSVIEIFLVHFQQGVKRNIVGFFGDAMQNIYDNTVGNLDEYTGNESNTVQQIVKSQNRRNPLSIIELANKLRTDGIRQIPSEDKQAPNMINGDVKQGGISFLYSNDDDISKVEVFLRDNHGWHLEDTAETKQLNLTHNLIASKAGFPNLIEIYDKDQIINFKDRLKSYIKNNEILTDFSTSTFGEVVDVLQAGKTGSELTSVSPTRAMKNFIDNNIELFEYAKSLDYSKFSKIFISKDQLIDDKKQDQSDENMKGSNRDKLISHLFKIQKNISLYQNKKYNEFLRATDYRHKLLSVAKKRKLKECIESLVEVEGKTIEQVVNEAHELGICLIDDKLNSFKEKNEYLYNRVKDVKFSEFQKLYDYLEGYTPFSTQHKTKGAEFDNVLVILDNGGWNNYNFEKMFLNTASESVMKRTQKLFYVCCTRSKENLAVFFHSPNSNVIEVAKEWFGDENVICLDV